MSNQNTQNPNVQAELLPVVSDTPTLSTFDSSVFEVGGSNFISSIQDDGTRASKIKIYNAINDTENSLSDFIGSVLEFEHMVAHPITVLNEQTKEPMQAWRVVLITPEGESYQAVSAGVTNSLARIIQLCGKAPWTPAIKVSPIQKKTNNNNYKTIVLKMVE